MKTILVDAVAAFIIETEKENFEIFEPMRKILDEFPNRKIILTGANDEQFKKFGLDKMPYEVFTLKHDPEKVNPEYYKKMLEHFNLEADDVVYFEHSPEAVTSAQSVGIKTHYWDNERRPLRELSIFLEHNT
ncbi:MAG: HAD hydrolase-like protein [Candidatus Falkowbacteria bacterium]|nr:HAD hydrolase-like protein [Candidatus Falkowbacteria bacterium]